VPLSPAELVRLEGRYGSLEAAAEALPEQRDEILAALATLRSVGRGQDDAFRRVREQVWEATDAANVVPPSREATSEPMPELPLLPQRAASFTFGTVEKAVRGFEGGRTRNEVATDARLRSPHNATRIRRLCDGGLLRLNDEGKLVVSPRVARTGQRIVLRYLDERGERWLDPLDRSPRREG